MDGRQLLLGPECSPLQHALKGEPEAAHEIGSGGQGVKVFLRARDSLLKPQGISLPAGEHEWAAVQSGQRLSNLARTLAQGPEIGRASCRERVLNGDAEVT